ncbi:hypothetical protein [Bifidobacterium dentium]|uniref:Uncharacterized protein n=1 Tax=Bifidobacterium dentium JCVIHMP022 TaxID=553191 RepID=A0AB72Z1Q8_9BIFI|nr:hypothetical protein [Bifidobacterium dentium]EFO78087.1 hypothetical protein HMPREF9003_0218 [Bifidobacterium dentium JCVIHMP022]
MALVNKDFITPAEASGIVLGAYQGATSALPFGQILTDMNNPTGINVSWVPNQPRFEVDTMEYSSYDAEAPYDETHAGGKKKLRRCFRCVNVIAYPKRTSSRASPLRASPSIRL